MTGKPTPGEAGIDVAALSWRRSGVGAGSVEIAMAPMGSLGDPTAPVWVLMRVAGDEDGRVLLFDRNEWECFLDGVRNGEFDDAFEKRPAT